MKKEKGFTLIELLAVIVLLAILMVIAVPKILNVIENSRKSAAESSIKLVKDAIKTQVTSGSIMGTNFTSDESGCYTFNFDDQTSGNAKELQLKNKENIKGTIKYCNGKFSNDTLKFEGTSVSGSGNGGETAKVCKRVTREEDLHTETCEWNDATYYCSGAGYTESGKKGTTTITYGNLGTSGTLTSGDAFDCDVNGDGTYDSTTERFYYVTEENNVAVLIYYNNFKSGKADNTSVGLIAYDGTHGTISSAKNWYGPITAITNLPTKSQWSKVSLVNNIRTITNENGGNTTKGGTLPSNFSYEGYAARLLTYQEMTRACGTTGITYVGYLNKCNYLMENTRYSSDKMGTNGYWLENPRTSYSNIAWIVNGTMRTNGEFCVSDAGLYGVRPAIEVLKSDIEY